MTQIHSFPPISDPSVTRLILGSMPGKASLKANQYYAHPQNAFWKILAQLLNFEQSQPYEQKCSNLLANHIALWDVLKTCTRTTSLDSDILESSIIPNDLATFLSTHPNIHTIYFNGAKAQTTYQKHILPNLAQPAVDLPLIRLPSSSPAHASITFKQKLEKWKAISA